MDTNDLYGLPLERFTEERNALVKELRKQGQREQAAKASKLRKPSVAAWAVNQLVRTQRREVAELFRAGDALQNAQAQLLAGRGKAGALRAAVDAERVALDQLAQTARGLLSSEGHELTSATLERVSETLHAAALDAGARAQVQGGCLARELRHVGLGERAPARGSRAAGRRGRRPAATKPVSADARPARRESAHEAQAQARRDAERAARDLRDAQARRDRAAAALHDAEVLLSSAREQAAQARRKLKEVQRGIEG